MAYDRHISDLTTLEKEYNTDFIEGLSSREAKSRLERERKRGATTSLFVPGNKDSIAKLFVFFCSPFVVLLLIMSLLTAFFGRPILGYSVFAVTFAFAAVGGFISWNSNKTLASAREYASPMVRVRRGGNIFYTDGRNVVKGDVVILGEGDLLPFDARIIKCAGLEVDELVPFESKLKKRRVAKDGDVTYSSDDKVAEFDAVNMLYAGSAVISGRAIALVVANGNDTLLSATVPEGALGGKDGESEGMKQLKTMLYKISFICASSLLLLSLIALLTLRGKESFICSFIMVLSAIFLISTELLRLTYDKVFSCFIGRLAKLKSTKRHRDNSALIRNVKVLDKLTEVTDLILVGSAGISEGQFKVSGAFAGEDAFGTITSETANGSRLLDLIFTFVKAKRESEVDKIYGSDGIVDALYAYLRGSEFDAGGASLAIRSLYLTKDAKNGHSYACVETDIDFYRTALISDLKIINECNKIRIGESLRDITNEDRSRIADFCRSNASNCAKYLVCVSENNEERIFEGVITLEQQTDREFASKVAELKEFGVRVSIILNKEDDDNERLIKNCKVEEALGGKIAYASEFTGSSANILELIDSYRTYVGFSNEEIFSLISQMKKQGAIVAAYGIDNTLNETMARADVAISCDSIRYSSDKHREAVYERMPTEGNDTSLRASQQTRLLSKVLVKRVHKDGGGLSSIFKAIRMSRGAHVTFGYSILLFVLLMSNLVTFTAMSVLTGNILLDPMQTVALSVVFAVLSITAFTDSEQSHSVTCIKRNYVRFPLELIMERLPDIISRSALAFVSAITIKILDVCGVFGNTPNYTMPIFLCFCLTLFGEVFMINLKFTKKGEGRGYCWIKVVIAYAILLFICYLSTQKPFSGEFLSNGIGSREYFIIPAYVLLYFISIGVVRLISKARKNS